MLLQQGKSFRNFFRVLDTTLPGDYHISGPPSLLCSKKIYVLFVMLICSLKELAPIPPTQTGRASLALKVVLSNILSPHKPLKEMNLHCSLGTHPF